MKFFRGQLTKWGGGSKNVKSIKTGVKKNLLKEKNLSPVSTFLCISTSVFIFSSKGFSRRPLKRGFFI